MDTTADVKVKTPTAARGTVIHMRRKIVSARLGMEEATATETFLVVIAQHRNVTRSAIKKRLGKNVARQNSPERHARRRIGKNRKLPTMSSGTSTEPSTAAAAKAARSGNGGSEMKKTEVEKALADAWREYQSKVSAVLRRVQGENVEPYCTKAQVNFASGMGIYSFFKGSPGYKGYVGIDESKLPKRLLEVLDAEVPGWNGFPLGTGLCDDRRFEGKEQPAP